MFDECNALANSIAVYQIVQDISKKWDTHLWCPNLNMPADSDLSECRWLVTCICDVAE